MYDNDIQEFEHMVKILDPFVRETCLFSTVKITKSVYLCVCACVCVCVCVGGGDRTGPTPTSW